MRSDVWRQSVRAAAGVPRTTTGLDADEKVSGRKPGLTVDVMGLSVGMVVSAASAHDNTAGTALLHQAAERCGMSLEKALVDQSKGCVPQPKRWVVEQTNGTLMLHRRLAREYGHRPDTSASRVHWAFTAHMTRRLTRPSPAWCDSLGPAA